MDDPDQKKTAGADDQSETGLPLLRTWLSVYMFVFGTFVVWVGLLTVLSLAYR